MSSPPLLNELARTLQDAQVSLDQITRAPFSPEGFERLKYRINQYIAQLITEAIRVSKSRQSDCVSPTYVDHASQYLFTGKGPRLYKFIGIIGGALFGIGAAGVVTMIQANQYTTRGIVLNFSCAVLGALTISLQLSQD
jgi:hypothetical protein